jgi:hypothetical protein
MSNFIEICPVGVEFYVEGRTDRRTRRHDEANSRFSQFGERVQNPPVVSSSPETLFATILFTTINTKVYTKHLGNNSY